MGVVSPPFLLKAAADATPGVRLVGLDMTIDGQSNGRRFDFMIGISPESSAEN